MHEFETRVRGVDWAAYNGPDHYRASGVPMALINLEQLSDPQHAEVAYNEVLSAIGNNHGGTYYPAVLKAMEFLVEIASKKNERYASKVATEIIVDLTESFAPELGTYNKHTEEQIAKFVKSVSVNRLN